MRASAAKELTEAAWRTLLHLMQGRYCQDCHRYRAVFSCTARAQAAGYSSPTTSQYNLLISLREGKILWYCVIMIFETSNYMVLTLLSASLLALIGVVGAFCCKGESIWMRLGVASVGLLCAGVVMSSVMDYRPQADADTVSSKIKETYGGDVLSSEYREYVVNFDSEVKECNLRFIGEATADGQEAVLICNGVEPARIAN